jgi:hypothetical protein
MYLKKAKQLPRREYGNNKFKHIGAFHGNSKGEWYLSDYFDKDEWSALLGMKSNLLSINNATEYNNGFLKALKEMVKEYPELLDFKVQFDGPEIPITKLIHTSIKSNHWETIVFYHGTNSISADIILKEGLKPRSITNIGPSYGALSGANQGNQKAIYLTTQIGMARFAAMDAAKLRKGRNTCYTRSKRN